MTETGPWPRLVREAVPGPALASYRRPHGYVPGHSTRPRRSPDQWLPFSAERLPFSPEITKQYGAHPRHGRPNSGADCHRRPGAHM